MIKKILVSFGVLFSFFLMFFLGFDKINVLAYSDIGSALGSYPVKLDIDNYNRNNLIDLCDYTPTSSYGFTTTIDENCLFDIVGNGNTTGYADLTINRSITFEPGDYTLIINKPIELVFYASFYDSVNSVSNRIYISNGSTYKHFTLNVQTDLNRFYLSSVLSGSYNIQDLGVSIVKGNSTEYSPFFKFGFNVSYSLSVNNLTSSQVNAGISIINENGDYLKTGSCVIPANSSTICNNLDDALYLPFYIDNNGYISFNYSLGLFLGPVGNLSVNPNDSGFSFVPVFNAYYKDSSTNNLYFKDRYIFNNLFLSGFNVSVNSSSLSNVVFGSNEVDSSFSMNSNNVINFATDKKNETGIYDYIDYVSYINSIPNDIYSFVITTGVSSPSSFGNRFYTISFSYLSLRVSGDIGNVTPLPNNPNTINKYNECSAWYDIPCQLGNGLTYVIYEAPIISPVLTFIVSFIIMFSSLVSFVDLFRSFGIVFGCFIIYMFIELLYKYSK